MGVDPVRFFISHCDLPCALSYGKMKEMQSFPTGKISKEHSPGLILMS